MVQINVAGANFNVQKIFLPEGHDNRAWEPNAKTAAYDLAFEVQAYCQREQGNVLVFVPTIRRALQQCSCGELACVPQSCVRKELHT